MRQAVGSESTPLPGVQAPERFVYRRQAEQAEQAEADLSIPSFRELMDGPREVAP